MKSDAAARGSAHAQMLELARAHNAANPKLSPEQSYAAVYTSPQNVGLKAQLAGESLALWNGDSTMQGDTAYNQRNNPVGRERGGQAQTVFLSFAERRCVSVLSVIPADAASESGLPAFRLGE
jgi:hypothetical protein